MFDDALISLLPEVYEGLESTTSTPNGNCVSGWGNSITYCQTGQCVNA